MSSIKAFGKLLVEPKTLGWEHSKKDFENVFENLGVVSTSLNCFQKGFGTNGVGKWRKRRWWFYKKTLVIMYAPR
jgi:hypothetical protein